MESKLSVLVDKLFHNIPQVRERAITSIHSKVRNFGSNTMQDFPIEKLMEGLAQALKHGLSTKVEEECIWLMQECKSSYLLENPSLDKRTYLENHPSMHRHPQTALNHDRENFITANSAVSVTPSFSIDVSASVLSNASASSPHRISAENDVKPRDSIPLDSSTLVGMKGNLAYYHDGWRPGSISVDDSDMKRIGDIERLLCTTDSTSKRKGCMCMIRLLADMPVGVLLERPHSLHAISAAIKSPLSEYMHSSFNNTTQKAMFDGLLVDIIETFECIASSISSTVQMQNCEFVGGFLTHKNAMDILKDDNKNNALWGSLNQRYPSLLDASSHFFASNPTSLPDTSTPLSLGGCALLVLRACFPLIKTTSVLSNKTLKIVYLLLPLLAEGNLPVSSSGIDSSYIDHEMRALTVTRCEVVLSSFLDLFGIVDIPCSIDLARSVLPFHILHFLLASSQVLPTSWVSYSRSETDSFLIVGDLVVNMLEEIAFSAIIRRTHTAMAVDCADLLLMLKPHSSNNPSIAMTMLEGAKPVSVVSTGYITDREVWVDDWLHALSVSLEKILPFAFLKKEANAVASNLVFLWSIMVTGGAVIRDASCADIWSQRLEKTEELLSNILKLELHDELYEHENGTFSEYLHNAVLSAFVAIFNCSLRCAVRDDLQASGFQCADELRKEQLMQLLTSPVFSKMLKVTVDQLSSANADLTAVSITAASLVAPFLSEYVVCFDEFKWHCGVQLHLTMALCQVNCLKEDSRNKVALLGRDEYYLRLLFEDASSIRLSGAEWLVAQPPLPDTCLTESCRVPFDFMANLRTNAEEEMGSQIEEHFSNDGDIEQLVRLVLDSQLMEATRVAACHHLSSLICRLIESLRTVIDICSSDLISLVPYALYLASPISKRTITESCDRSAAALDLLLCLLWVYPNTVRPILLEHMTSSSSSCASLFTSVLPWMFGSGCPHPAIRLCSGKAALVLWRTLFDPGDFVDLQGKSQDMDIFPIGLLIAFPSPPLSCLQPCMQRMISSFLNRDVCANNRSTALSQYSPEVLSYVQSELRLLTFEPNERESAIYNLWCPVEHAEVLKKAMVKSSSHQELATSIITAASRSVVDPLFVMAFLSCSVDTVRWDKAMHLLLTNVPTTPRDYRLLQSVLLILVYLIPQFSHNDLQCLVAKMLDVMIPLLQFDEGMLTSRKDLDTCPSGVATLIVPEHLKLSIRLSVLRLFKSLSSTSSAMSLRMLTDPRISSQLLSIISTPLNACCEVTKIEALSLVACCVRSLRGHTLIDSKVLHMVFPVLLQQCVACLSLPRLPDSWSHKGIVRAAMDAISSILTVCYEIDYALKVDTLVCDSTAATLNDPGGGRRRNLKHWCRRLCCDREASIRAFSFATLAILVSNPVIWSLKNQDDEHWTLSDACIAAMRAVEDNSEAPIVRAAALDVISGQLGETSELGKRCAECCCRYFTSCERNDAVTSSIAASCCKAITIFNTCPSPGSLENWNKEMWDSGAVARLVDWINPKVLSNDTCISSGTAAHALRLTLASAKDVLEFKVKLFKSTNVLENCLWVLQHLRAENEYTSHQTIEVSLLLHDLLVHNTLASSAFVSKTDRVPPVTINLARIIMMKSEQINEATFAFVQSASIRLIYGILMFPVWSSAVAVHLEASCTLWKSLVQVRASTSNMSPCISTGDSLNCHLALAALVELNFRNVDSTIFDDLVSQVCAELESMFDAHLVAKQGSKALCLRSELVCELQARLFLLRSFCLYAQLNIDTTFRLNVLVDRLWPLDIKSEFTGVTCLGLLLDILRGIASNVEVSKMLCSHQRSSTPVSESASCQSSHSMVSRTTLRTDDSRSLSPSSSAKKVLHLFLTPYVVGNTQINEARLGELLGGGLVWRKLVMCAEGRLLISSYFSMIVSLLRSLLNVPRPRRAEASVRLTSLLQILVTASINDHEFQQSLFKVKGFVDFLTDIIAQLQHLGEGCANRTTTLQSISDGRFIEGGELVCNEETAELVSLLLRNLARYRGNKAKLCATPGVLDFLLLLINSAKLKLVAAASSALWAILHDCERAKSALRLLNTLDVVAKTIKNLETSSSGHLSSAVSTERERSIRHLTIVFELISQ